MGVSYSVQSKAYLPDGSEYVPKIQLPDGSSMEISDLLGSQRPRFWTAPPRHREKQPGCRTCSQPGYPGIGCGDYASHELVYDWAPSFGYQLDDWQQFWLTEACGVRPDGRWSAFEVAAIVSRQNGKNVNLEVRELGGLFLFGEQMIIHTAHEFKAAAEHFRRVRDTIQSYDELSRRLKRVMTSHGDEAIELRPTPTLIFGSNGTRVRKSVTGRLRFLARSRGSGRSFTADCVVYDEAMFLSDEQVGASMPTMSAVPNPQMYYTASAGYKDSVQLALVRRRVMRGDQTVMGAEWSADPHLDTCPRDEVRGRRTNHYVVCDRHDDRDDPRTWAKANPAMGRRMSFEHVLKEFNAMTPTAFERERLGIGDWPSEEEAWAVVSEEAWDKCALADPGGATRPIAFAVDVNPEMTVATIAAAWERPESGVSYAVHKKEYDADGSESVADAGRDIGTGRALGPPRLTYRTVLEIPRGCSREGTAWVVDRLNELRLAWRPVAVCIPRNGPAAALVDEAIQRGMDILVASSADEAAAFSLMVTGVRDRKIAHLGKDQAPSLRSAVASAETRVVGDGGQGWCRRDSGEDITPVTAATLAYWALNKKRRNYDLRKSVA